MKVDGKALQVRIGGHTIALSTGCTIDDAVDLIDAKTKDDVGAVDVPGDTTCTISTKSLLGENLGTTQQTYATLKALLLQKQKFEIEVFLAANAHERLAAPDWVPGPIGGKGFSGHSGYAYLRSLQLNGDIGNKATIAATFAVQGELTPVAPTGLNAPDVASRTLRLTGAAELRGSTLYIESAASHVESGTLYLNSPEPEPINS